MSEKCPTCGSDDPAKLRAYSGSAERWIPWWPSEYACRDPWHTALQPKDEPFAQTNANYRDAKLSRFSANKLDAKSPEPAHDPTACKDQYCTHPVCLEERRPHTAWHLGYEAGRAEMTKSRDFHASRADALQQRVEELEQELECDVCGKPFAPKAYKQCGPCTDEAEAALGQKD